jgi:O-acetyl-ADP-ribose deacetylase (regulator of RNase III)
MLIQLVKGDITKIEVDGIVNAANAQLAGGGGVDGAIHRAGGRSIMEELAQIRNRQGGCPTGEAVITNAGDLPAKKVIHAVGPIWAGGSKGEPEKLRNAYLNSLKLADRYDLKSVSFPNISTGIYGYPKTEAAWVAIDAVREFARFSRSLERVVFVCYDVESFQIYEDILQKKGLIH